MKVRVVSTQSIEEDDHVKIVSRDALRVTIYGKYHFFSVDKK
jgi:membrane-bound ClpP family serine protease